MKNLQSTFVVTFIFLSFRFFAQTPIDVAESTFKVNGLGEEVFYYGFAEGDQLIFTFEEVDRKELKEIEIIELPSFSKFMDYKTRKIDNKTIMVSRTGIYKFRFANSAIGGRVCRFKIQRIPASDAKKNFNSSVYWRTAHDTTYTTEQEQYLIRSDTSVANITDQIVKVHSVGNLNGNKTSFNFTLPSNTVAWSYYIGVDQAGQEAYERATAKLARVAGPMLAKFPEYGPLAALALGGISYLSQIQSGEDIDFYLVDNDNVNLFLNSQGFRYIRKGKVINDYSRMISPVNGMYHICLSNDNAVTGVNVTVKITAITVTNQWGNRPIQRMHVSSRQEAYLKD